MTDLTKRKLEACQLKSINTTPYSKELQALKAENARLKELMKECRFALETYAKEDETCGLDEELKYAKILLPKINEVCDNQ